MPKYDQYETDKLEYLDVPLNASMVQKVDVRGCDDPGMIASKVSEQLRKTMGVDTNPTGRIGSAAPGCKIPIDTFTATTTTPTRKYDEPDFGTMMYDVLMEARNAGEAVLPKKMADNGLAAWIPPLPPPIDWEMYRKTFEVPSTWLEPYEWLVSPYLARTAESIYNELEAAMEEFIDCNLKEIQIRAEDTGPMSPKIRRIASIMFNQPEFSAERKRCVDKANRMRSRR